MHLGMAYVDLCPIFVCFKLQCTSNMSLRAGKLEIFGSQKLAWANSEGPYQSAQPHGIIMTVAVRCIF